MVWSVGNARGDGEVGENGEVVWICVKLLRMVPSSENNDVIDPLRAIRADALQISALHKQGPCFHVDEYLSNSRLWLIMLGLLIMTPWTADRVVARHTNFPSACLSRSRNFSMEASSLPPSSSESETSGTLNVGAALILVSAASLTLRFPIDLELPALELPALGGIVTGSATMKSMVMVWNGIPGRSIGTMLP